MKRYYIVLLLVIAIFPVNVFGEEKYIESKDLTFACSRWDKDNEVTYKEKYNEKTCKTNSNRISQTKYGKKIDDLDVGTCRTYCKEQITLSFPGNITIARQKGTYFAWPSAKDGSDYKLSIAADMIRLDLPKAPTMS